MTNLEKAVQSNPIFKKAVQKALDEIAESVLAEMKTIDIIDHTTKIYNDTVEEYVKNPHTKNIIPELLDFMSMVPNRGKVLDIGCGPGRDAFFMTVQDPNFREMFMEKIKGGVSVLQELHLSEKTFQVHGIDSSVKMLRHALEKKKKFLECGLLTSENLPCSCFSVQEMHGRDDGYSSQCDFDGIWSCAALFTHTPKSLIGPAIKSVSSCLRTGGVFFTSYTNGVTEGVPEKLLLSSTGKIKYFSHSDPREIEDTAKKYSLELIKESFSDYEINGKVIKKDLFVSQFYRKV